MTTREEKTEDVCSKYLDKPWEQGERRRVGDPKYEPHDDAWWAERHRTPSHQTDDFPDRFCKECTHFRTILGGFCAMFGSFISTANKWWCPFYIDEKEVENE